MQLLAMADFDTVSKHFIQTYPADFARFALQRDDIERVKVLDTEQPNVRRPDSLLRVRVGGKDVLVHHEFQTTDSTNPSMPRRMASYIGHLIGRYGLPVHSYVLYLRPNAGRRDPGYYIQEHPDHLIVIRYKVLRLSQLPGQAVLASGSAGLLPFAPLMQAAGRTGWGRVAGAVCGQGVGRAAGTVGQSRCAYWVDAVERLSV